MKTIQIPNNVIDMSGSIAVTKMIEQQEKLMKILLPSKEFLDYSSYAARIANEQFERIKKIVQPPITLENATNFKEIGRLAREHHEQWLISTQPLQRMIEMINANLANYNRFQDQAGSFLKVINSPIFKQINDSISRAVNDIETLNYFDVSYVNAYSSIKDAFNDVTEREVDNVKIILQNNTGFRSEVADMITSKPIEYPADFGDNVRYMIEKNVGKTKTRVLVVIGGIITLGMYAYDYYNSNFGSRIEIKEIIKNQQEILKNQDQQQDSIINIGKRINVIEDHNKETKEGN